jgi:hypothetical protein
MSCRLHVIRGTVEHLHSRNGEEEFIVRLIVVLGRVSMFVVQIDYLVAGGEDDRLTALLGVGRAVPLDLLCRGLGFGHILDTEPISFNQYNTRTPQRFGELVADP